MNVRSFLLFSYMRLSVTFGAKGTGFNTCYLPILCFIKHCYGKEEFDNDRSQGFWVKQDSMLGQYENHNVGKCKHKSVTFTRMAQICLNSRHWHFSNVMFNIVILLRHLRAQSQNRICRSFNFACGCRTNLTYHSACAIQRSPHNATVVKNDFVLQAGGF